ncbi:unnamed protein product [Caenorhabditis bovis]|uniref:Uncharacterized protein n=1 Tax=Caenorhabditis bovis TaxID=2654633 RepID=A0A8S1EEB3_9PELO|nr:unnamed protein product [Caenorhabditis bovis]
MNKFKWHLLFYQAISSLLDFCFSIGFSPVAIPAITFGYSTGIFRFFLDARDMISLAVVLMTMSGLSILEIFLYRWQSLQFPNSPQQLSTRMYIFICVLVVSTLLSTVFGLYLFLATDQKVWMEKLSRKYSCIEFLMTLPAAYVCDPMKYFGVALYGSITTVNNDYGFRKSKKQKQMQKRLLYMLCAQVMFPFSAYFVGGLIIITSLTFQIKGTQNAFNFAVFLFSHYGFATSFAVVLCNDPYRYYTKNLIMKSMHSIGKHGSKFQFQSHIHP